MYDRRKKDFSQFFYLVFITKINIKLHLWAINNSNSLFMINFKSVATNQSIFFVSKNASHSWMNLLQLNNTLDNDLKNTYELTVRNLVFLDLETHPNDCTSNELQTCNTLHFLVLRCSYFVVLYQPAETFTSSNWK